MGPNVRVTPKHRGPDRHDEKGYAKQAKVEEGVHVPGVEIHIGQLPLEQFAKHGRICTDARSKEQVLLDDGLAKRPDSCPAREGGVPSKELSEVTCAERQELDECCSDEHYGDNRERIRRHTILHEQEKG
jgi:hypothetical protein